MLFHCNSYSENYRFQQLLWTRRDLTPRGFLGEIRFIPMGEKILDAGEVCCGHKGPFTRSGSVMIRSMCPQSSAGILRKIPLSWQLTGRSPHTVQGPPCVSSALPDGGSDKHGPYVHVHPIRDPCMSRFHLQRMD